MDVFENPYWTLPQALAWIYLRDRKSVQDASDDVNAIILEIWAADGGCPAFGNSKEAAAALCAQLEKGSLAATGLANNHGDRTGIEPQDWVDLVFDWKPPHAAPKDPFRPGAKKWFNLRFQREEIQQIWTDNRDDARQVAEAESRAATKAVPARQRSVDPKDEASLKSNINSVLSTARRIWKEATNRPPLRKMAKVLHAEEGKKIGYSESTIRQILRGSYPPMKRRGMPGLGG